MNGFEITILDNIQKIFGCAFLDKTMPIITLFGESGIFFIAVSLIMIFIRKTRKIGISAGLSLAIGFILCNIILKNAVGRIRPYDFNPNVTLLVKRLTDYSFPSGHSVAAFEFATSLFIRNKKYGIMALVLAVLIAFSRLYLYVHFPSDVFCGMILGIGVAIISCLIVDKFYGKFFDDQNKLKRNRKV